MISNICFLVEAIQIILEHNTSLESLRKLGSILWPQDLSLYLKVITPPVDYSSNHMDNPPM